MATLGLKEMVKLPLEGREKPKVARAKFIGKMQKKSGIMKIGLGAMPLFLLDNLLNFCSALYTL